MMLHAIGNIHGLISGTSMEHMRCFQRDVETFTSVTLLVMLKQFQIKLGRKRGHQLFSDVLAEVRRAVASGVIAECPASQLMPEPQRLTKDEFRQLMSRFSVMERSLICFAIDTGMDIDEAAGLEHKQVRILINLNRKVWHEEVARLIRWIPRHIRSPYVFWEASNDGGAAGPIMDMKSRFKRTAMINWPAFVRLVGDMLDVGQEFNTKELECLLLRPE